MTNEQSLTAESTNNEPSHQISEVDHHSKKYTAEQFKRDLEKAQTQEISIKDTYRNKQNEEKTFETPVAPEENVQEFQVDQVESQNESSKNSDQDDDEDYSNHGQIPKKRFNKEIERRKALQAELDREREARIRYETEIQLYNKALDGLHEKNNPTNTEDTIDPVDETAHNFYLKKIRELENKFDQRTQNLSDTQRQALITNSLNQQQVEYSRKVPDFDKALEHVINTEVNSLKLVGINDQEAQVQVRSRLSQIANAALTNGKDVPDIFYNMAKSYGYAAPKPQNNRGANLEKLEQNIKKSESIINDVPGVSATFAPDASVYATNKGFQERLMNKNGKGVNRDAFHAALEKLKNNR